MLFEWIFFNLTNILLSLCSGWRMRLEKYKRDLKTVLKFKFNHEGKGGYIS